MPRRVLVLSSLALACSAPPAATQRPAGGEDLRFDVAAIDRAVDPCVGAPARAAAIRKLDNMRFMIGYSDRGKRYDALEVGVIRNMPEFAAAFSCPAGVAMAPVDRCRLW